MSKLKKIPTPTYMYTNKCYNTVKKVKITRQTDFSVFFKNGGRSLKTTQYSIYRDTAQEVLDWIENKLKNMHKSQQGRVSYTKEQLDKFFEYKKEIENGTPI